MNLDKAIEILDDFRKDPNAFFTKDLPDAVKLGIEALEFLAQWEREHDGKKFVILPGETEGVTDEPL